MLGNLKEFISVVQDGLTSNSNIRQTLQEVQKVKNIFKDRQKGSTEAKVNYGAGGALLEKYQEEWAELHENADKNAKAADEVDKLILELHETTKVKLQTANEFSQALSHLPNLTASVAQCMDSLRNVQTLLKSVEEDLVEFEDIVERSKMESWKLDHHYHLTMYKEKKMVALESIRSELAKKNTEQSLERERQQLAEFQAKRDHSAVAFQCDMAKYLISGNVPSVAPASPITLEQVQLDEDPTDLEKFLDS
ncbi:dysbindin [Ostrinia nubilalis]|uniref:dysbindin n=1 Tax=Ostrinia furnacalis TaxID=93504 RepID=UPI00103CC6DD|nr:dysbindin [Ostrinia furnacalis]